MTFKIQQLSNNNIPTKLKNIVKELNFTQLLKYRNLINNQINKLNNKQTIHLKMQ